MFFPGSRMQMEKLLHAHQDLLEESKSFLPNVTARPFSGQTCIRYSHKQIVVNVGYHVL